MSGIPEFDPTAPLPGGTTVLEASAGTGKTHALADLAVRLIAAGAGTIDRLLLVTFSRNATRELRARVRSHLLLATAAAAPGEARGRLEAAVAGFDAARVMTIHEFCAAMYPQLGILASADPSGSVLSDLTPLVRDVAGDLYVSRYAFDVREPPFPFQDDKQRGVVSSGALRLAADAVSFALRPIEPCDAEGSVAQRVDFAQQVREVAAERRRQLGVLTFDDQLVRLRDTLADPITGSASRERLRARFDAVLVDEFQDTDPVQWQILRLLFDGHRRLVLIGDPKQAIYTFRGADIAAYTAAVDQSGARFSLSVNHRSDEALVHALGELFADLQLGDGIEVHPVSAHRAGSGCGPPRRRYTPSRCGRSTTRSNPGRPTSASAPIWWRRCAPFSITSSCATAIAGVRCVRATWPCSSGRTKAPPGPPQPCARQAFRWRSAAPTASTTRRPAATGWCCCRHWRRSADMTCGTP